MTLSNVGMLCLGRRHLQSHRSSVPQRVLRLAKCFASIMVCGWQNNGLASLCLYNVILSGRQKSVHCNTREWRRDCDFIKCAVLICFMFFVLFYPSYHFCCVFCLANLARPYSNITMANEDPSQMYSDWEGFTTMIQRRWFIRSHCPWGAFL